MISFAHPLWLLALPLAPLVGWWLSRGRRPALRYSDVTLVDGLPRGRAAWLPAASLGLRITILALLIVAAAGPRVPDGKTRLPVEGIAIALTVDVSGSMAEADYPSVGGPISRLAAAKATLNTFVTGGEVNGQTFRGRPDDQLAIVSFAAWPDTVCPPTLNRSVVSGILSELQAKSGADAGTNIGDAIAEALVRLESTGPRRKVLVLLSDGEHNIALDRADPPLKPRQAAQLAVDLGIPIYAIDCGGTVPMEAEAIERRTAGQRTLNAIATMTGGRSFTASDADNLASAIAEIDQLERRPAESFRYRRYWEWDWWCGAAAVILLLSLFVLESIVARPLI